MTISQQLSSLSKLDRVNYSDYEEPMMGTYLMPVMYTRSQSVQVRRFK